MAADPLIGRAFGKCRIESRIGAGGMGVVYLAEHTVIHDRRAVKVLSASLAGQEEYRDRFLKEARLPASLNHPSILAVHDAGDEDGILYLIMPYVRGADLQALIDGSGALDVDEAVSILSAVADALDEAHQAGLVHRDVKPSNVLVGDLESKKRRQVYLSDFGLVKALDQATRASGTTKGIVVGTPPYIAPELWREEPFDGRLDQYALACTMFYALTGAPPFDASTMYAWMHAHTAGPIPSASQLRPELPRDVDEPLARGMAKDPAERFETCTALVDAVASSVGSIPLASNDTLDSRLREQTRLGIETVARQRSAPSAGPAPDGGRRAALIAAAVAIVTMVAFLVWLLWPDGSTVATTTGPTETRTTGPPPEAAAIEPLGQLGSAPLTAARDRADGSVLVAVEGEIGLGTEILRVDPETGGSTKVADVPGTPTQMLVEDQVIWILTEEGPLYVVEGGGTEQLEIAMGGHPERMAPTSRAMWVTLPVQDRVNLVHKDDPTVVDRAPLPGGPRYLTVASGVMLVVGDGGQVSSLDLQTGQPIATEDLGGVPVSLTSARGDGWVAMSDGKVARVIVEEDALVVEDVADVGGRPLRISPAGGDGGAVWIPDQASPVVSRIDTLPPNDVRPEEFPDIVVRLSTADPQVVIAVTSAGEVYRLGAVSATIVGEPDRIEGSPGPLVATDEAAVLFSRDGAVYVIPFEPSDG